MIDGLTLVTGGARSGKSTFAQQLAAASGRPVTFVATAEARDEDMRQRIERHRASRPQSWLLIEEPLSVAVVLRARWPSAGAPGQPATSETATAGSRPVFLLDCITLLVSNLMLAGRAVEGEIDALIAWQQAANATLIAVTNETGLGIVPDNELARRYRDELGLANQRLAASASQVVLMVAGIPVPIKRAR